MSGHSLAVVQPMATSIHQEKEAWGLMREQAAILIKTGFLPEAIRTPEQAIHIMMKGRELGIPATYALSNIAIVKGKPSCSAELMLALIRRDHSPAAIRVKDSTNDACTVEWRTPGWDGTQTYRFSVDDAKQAGLVQPNSNWTKYPAAMLRARAISAVARMAFPESIAGMYTPGEMGEPVSVNDDGEVLSASGEVLGEIVEYDPGIGSERVTEAEFIPATPKNTPHRPQAVATAQDTAPEPTAADRANDYRTTQNRHYHGACNDAGFSEAATKLFALSFFPDRTSRRELTGQELHDLADIIAPPADAPTAQIDLAEREFGRAENEAPTPLVEYGNRIAAAIDRAELARIAAEMKENGVATDWLRAMWKRRNEEVPAFVMAAATRIEGEAGNDKHTG